MLEEQDARPAFDIHKYGDDILDKLAVLSCKDPSHPVDLESQMVRAAHFCYKRPMLPMRQETAPQFGFKCSYANIFDRLYSMNHIG